jgi:hypothetical protein
MIDPSRAVTRQHFLNFFPLPHGHRSFRPGGAGVGAEVIDAELGEVIAGVRPGRTKPGQITIFRSVGLAFQDLVVAWLAYQGALERGIGHRVDFLRRE